jgi:hypothetical protein
LAVVRSVVEQQQRLAPVDAVAEHRCPLVQPRRNARGRHLQLTEEHVQDRAGIGRLMVRIEAAQVRIQLDVGISPGLHQTMRGVQGKLGLPDAGHPLDRRDHHGAGVVDGRVGQESQFLLASDECGQVDGELAQDPGLPAGLGDTLHSQIHRAPPLDGRLVLTERPDDGDHQIEVEPAPRGLEHLRDRGVRDHPRRPHQRPDLLGQAPDGRRPGPQPQLVQEFDELRQVSGTLRIRSASRFRAARHAPLRFDSAPGV